MKIKLVYISLILCLFYGCDLLQQEEQQIIIARVNEHKLYKDDLIKKLPKFISKEDSLSFTKRYIDQWAMQQIISDKAKFNLPLEEQERYNKMVQKYRSDLYKEAYFNALVQKQLKNTVDSADIAEYYEQNKDMFKVNEHLLKIRYIYAKQSLMNLKEVKQSFKRFNLEDQDFLYDEELKFDKIKLSDSVWVKSIDVYRDLNKLDNKHYKSLLSGNTYLEIKDSLGIYFFYIKEVLKPNSIAPLSYIKPTIKQILDNKNKQKLKLKLESEILNNAIKNNDYEVYE